MLAFSVLDKKAGSHTPPFFEKHVSGAIRSWEHVVNQKDSPYNLYPDEFELLQVGTFDSATGVLISSISSLGTARTFLKQ